jgi:hypothetical protein
MNAPLEELLEEVKQTQREALRQANLLAKVRAGVAEAQIRRPHAWTSRTLIGLATAGGVAVLAFVLLRPAPLSLAVGNPARTVHAGAIIEAPAVAPVPMQFGDGTTLALAPRARMAVASVGAHGATLRLERGRLGVGVVHRPGARWSVRAGAFEVKVTGTEFDVSFDPIADALTVEMRRGSVVVTGPGLPEDTRLGAGQILQAIGRDRHFAISAARGAPVAANPPVARVTAMAAPREMPPPAVEAEPAPVAPHLAPSHALRALEHGERGGSDDRGWKELALASRYDEALSAAEHAGFTSLCGRLDGADLMLLGDAARLAKQPNVDRAEEAYRAARSRFPRLDGPVFAMGKVAYEKRHRFHEAATWFETYLDSYPHGPLALEAAGRLIESWQSAGEGAKAQAASRAYLEKYPAGPYSALARRLSHP